MGNAKLEALANPQPRRTERWSVRRRCCWQPKESPTPPLPPSWGCRPRVWCCGEERFAGERLAKFAQVRKGRGRKPDTPRQRSTRSCGLPRSQSPRARRTGAAGRWPRRRGSRPPRCSGSGEPGPETSPGRDVQALQRQTLRRETGRRGRALPEPPGAPRGAH